MAAEPDASHGRSRDAFSSVRVKTTAGAALVVGLALLVAAIAMTLLLRRSLVQDIKTTARFRAAAVGDVLSSATDDQTIRLGDPEEEFVQVIDDEGNVVTSSANVAGDPPIAELEVGESESVEVPFEDDPFIALAVDGQEIESGYTILIGRSSEIVGETTAAVLGLLVLGLPLLLGIVTFVLWKVVGRALAPVESIRAEVDTITAEDVSRRVSEPHTKDEIARLAATMNRMLERIDAGQKRQRRFVSDASHELRSPIATIRQHAEVALTHPDSSSPEELARTVLAENERLEKLVEDLLVLARMDEGSRSLAEPVDLDDIVFVEIERLRGVSNKTIDAGRVSGGRVRGDARQLRRLVINLLDNAVRHARGNVEVSLSETNGSISLVVDDDGTGIPPADRDRVLERFVRLQEARDRDTGGSGLGLAIVAEVATAHGGSVSIVEAPSGGARIEVRLPRAVDG